MLNKIDSHPISPLSTQGFFAPESINTNSPAPNWQIIHSGYWHSILFNAKNNTVLGLGRNPFDRSDYHEKKVWTIPLRDEFKIKQIAAGDDHILILYDNGLLEGYGFGYKGQLGIGYCNNNEPTTVCISLPDNAIPVQIAAAKNYSLVIADNGELYGFGDNGAGQLGLGDISSAEFPTLIPLPDHTIPVRIFTGHNRTIIACKDDSLYGFGVQYNNQLGRNTRYDDPSEKIPSRLSYFESLNPANFCMGKDGIIVVAANGDCYFHGLDMSDLLPVKYDNSQRRLILPDSIKPLSISFNYNHILLQSEEGELWSTQFTRGTDKEKFTKINLPSDEKPGCIVAGTQASWFLGAKDSCFVSGDNDSCKLGLTDKHINLAKLSISQLVYQISRKTVKTKIILPGTNLLERLCHKKINAPCYQDNTAFIETLAQDDTHIIEILRPQGFGKSLALSTACAWFSNTSAAKELFQNNYIWSSPAKNSFGQYPVILLDLATLKTDSQCNFTDSVRELMAALFIKHRPALFSGILKNNKEEYDFYQKIILQTPLTWRDKIEEKDILKTLVTFLHKQYKKKVIILIDNADFCLRNRPPSYVQEAIERDLMRFINNAIDGDPCVSQTVLMGQYPSTFATKLKKTHDMADIDSPYANCFGFTRDMLQPFLKTTNETRLLSDLETKSGGYTVGKDEHINPQHAIQWLSDNKIPDLCISNDVIKQLVASSQDCEHIGELLQNNTICFMQNWLETPGLFNSLLQTGLLNIKRDTGSSAITIPNQSARHSLQILHTKWQKQNMKRVTVFLDIDETFATHDHCSPETALFFLRAGAIITAYGVTHYIPPGRLELLRYLFSMPEVKIAFFSSGAQRRNVPFVKALLIKALGKEHYAKIAADVVILSDCHCQSNTKYQDKIQCRTYGLKSNTVKKDISKGIADEDYLENAILIDNDPGVVYYGQEKNYLYAETLKSRDFETLKTLATENQSPDEVLYNKLNDIFRWTVLLKDCIQNRKTQPIQEKLFASQFAPGKTDNDGDPYFEPLWEKPGDYHACYQEGLAILQQFNPDLSLITTQYYQECIQPLPSSDQSQIVKDAIEHEYEDTCLVM